MLKGGIPIGRIWGISLRLHYSWFLIFAIVTWALVSGYFNTDWNLGARIAAGLITSVLFFISVLVHELMHSRVALSQGIKVDSIVLFALGGVSQIGGEPEKAGDEFIMAFAGPATSLILGGIFLGLWVGLRNITGFSFQFSADIFFWLGIINISLGIFNLIPGFPLDGGRVLRSILWGINKNLRQSTRIATTVGQVFGFLFIAAGIWMIFTGNLFNGVWIAVIGWFLQSSASSSYRQLILQDMLKGHLAKEIMSRECTLVSPDTTVEKLVNENILVSRQRCFPVISGNRIQGLVTLDTVRNTPRDKWATTSLQEAMIPLDKLKSVHPEDELSLVLKIMTENDLNQLPVVQDHNIIGMIGRDNLIDFLNTQRQLGS
jgi:Zn-dependent protease/predicted transcriptional regulator